MDYPQQYQNVPAPAGMGSGTKFVLGCGAIGCGMLVLLCSGIAALTYWGVGRVSQMAEEFTNEFEARGFEVSRGHVIKLTQKPDKPTIFVCQVLHIDEKVDVDIAAVVQVMEINADVDGDIEFLGQVLTLKPGVTVNGNIHARAAQIINIIDGTVVGKVTGTYQAVNGTPQGQTILRQSGILKSESELEIPLDEQSAKPESPTDAQPPAESPSAADPTPPADAPPTTAPAAPLPPATDPVAPAPATAPVAPTSQPEVPMTPSAEPK